MWECWTRFFFCQHSLFSPKLYSFLFSESIYFYRNNHQLLCCWAQDYFQPYAARGIRPWSSGIEPGIPCSGPRHTSPGAWDTQWSWKSNSRVKCLAPLFGLKNYFLGWSNSTLHRAFALLVVNLGSISIIPYCLLSLQGVMSECRTRNSDRCSVWPNNTKLFLIEYFLF